MRTRTSPGLPEGADGFREIEICMDDVECTYRLPNTYLHIRPHINNQKLGSAIHRMDERREMGTHGLMAMARSQKQPGSKKVSAKARNAAASEPERPVLVALRNLPPLDPMSQEMIEAFAGATNVKSPKRGEKGAKYFKVRRRMSYGCVLPPSLPSITGALSLTFSSYSRDYGQRQ